MEKSDRKPYIAFHDAAEKAFLLFGNLRPNFCLGFNLLHSNNVCSATKLDDQDKIEHEEPKLTPAEEKIRLNWL